MQLACQSQLKTHTTVPDAESAAEHQDLVDIEVLDVDWQTCISAEVPLREAIRVVQSRGQREAADMLRAAGYLPCNETGEWRRDGYVATIRSSDTITVRIWIRRADARQIWAAGPGGYVPSGDRPQV